MLKSKQIALAALALCASCASLSAVAADEAINPSWYIQPSVNAMKPDGDFGVDKHGFGAGLKFGKAVSDNWDVQMGATYARSRDNGQRYQQNTFGVDGLYLFSRSGFRPFLLVGAGMEHDKANLNAVGQLSKNSPFVSAGVGFQATLNDQWSMQADLRDVHGFIRGDEFATSKSNNYYLTVGLNYAFDKPAARPAPVAPVVAPQPVVEVAPPPPAPVAPPPPPPARFEKVTMSATELFDFGSAKLHAGQPKLDDMARFLNDNASVEHVVVTGYADRLGSSKVNHALSLRRAEAVKAYLVGKGVAASRINTAGKGEEQPVVKCDNKKQKRADLIKCLEPNRRVEIEQITVERRVN